VSENDSLKRATHRALDAGASGVARAVTRRLGSEVTYLGLRCDLNALPAHLPAAMELSVATVDPVTFTAFRAAIASLAPGELGELHLRQRLCDGGVRTLYVASSPGKAVVYTQWCVTQEDLHLIDAVLPDHFVRLGAGEVLLEGAYTFSHARRAGVMADVMWRLLDEARQSGAHTAYTYVEQHNAASLRGCAAVGFTAHHERRERWRLGRWSAAFASLEEGGAAAWATATAPRVARDATTPAQRPR
jgi:L-amino acid N-acyltransferase YncA